MQHRSHRLRPPTGRPSRAVLDLDTLPSAPGSARAWTRQILREWQLAVLSDAAELVVSELTTNAILASRRLGLPFIRLMLTLDQGELAIFVHDHCPSFPEPRNVGDEEENGRGLMLVEAMSTRSGWHMPEDGTRGKVVWATLSR